ncbi:hypothetical protein [Microbacterium sp.]|uniref:DUF7927 domain-containing protein n=1 Tax=Microbacterium sp. TaxID=51671 RepID=UPI0039E21BC4
MRLFATSRTSRREAGARRRPWRIGSYLGVVASLVASGLVIGVPSAAMAAGDGVLTVQLTPVDTTDGSVITSIADGQHNNTITYDVQYRCTNGACSNTQLQFSPSQPSPNSVLPADRFLLKYVSTTAATVSGTDVTGKLVTLGDLPAGTSGSFTIRYAVSSDTQAAIPYGSFYPDGFQIQMAATATSDTAVAPVTGASAPVTWHVAVPSGPSAGVNTANSVKTDESVLVNVTMGVGNTYLAGNAGRITGDAAYAAAGSYKVVYHAPPEAVIQTAAYGGVIDNAAHTVTWEVGSADDPKYAARGGFGYNQSNFGANGPADDNPSGSVLGDDNYANWNPRAVTLTFPGTNFPAADANGCNFATTVTSSVDVTVTYLDAAKTTKSVTATKTNQQVACWDPFGGINVSKTVAGGASNPGDGNMGSGVAAANIPAPGDADRTSLYWSVAVANRGNVPGVAIIDEPNLSQPDAPVYQLRPSGAGATVEWVRSDGVTGTTVLAANQALTAPGDTYYISAKVTSAPIAAGRIQKTDTGETGFSVAYWMRISSTAPLGEQRTNTANIEMTYPGYPDIEVIPLALNQTRSATIQFTRPSPAITATFVGSPVVGGAQLNPGVPVTYTVRGGTSGVWPGTEITPQQVFLAPVGWTVVPGSATIAGAPAGVTYEYATKTIGGVSRSVVVATWPSSIAPGTAAATWPDMTVQATPTVTASTAPNAGVAGVWMGDASGTLSDATGYYAVDANDFRGSPGNVVDAGDVDGDGITTEDFALGNGSPGLTVVQAPSVVGVVKELCVPDTSAADGCNWVSDATADYFVPLNATDIKYRVTLSNAGSTALTNVVGYDVLPYPNDTGLLAGPPSRGSEFDLVLQSVTSVSAGVTLAYSASTNPSRPEVYPGAAGTVDDWDSTPEGKKALRLTAGTLNAGASVQVVYTAAVAGSPEADQKACNTVAVDSSQTLPSEPLPVCVTLEEADLAIEVTTFENLQSGRPTTLAYTVTNNGGSASAPASASLGIPAGLTLTSLDVAGWSCAADGGGAAPVAGAATLTCAPVDAGGQARELLEDDSELLSFPVLVTADPGEELCVTAEVSGDVFDPIEPNNADSACARLAAVRGELVITKDDGITATKVGAEYTYTITVTNTLVAEAVSGAVVTDTLPEGLEFVSADADGTAAGQSVTWTLEELAPSSTTEVHVSVRVLEGAPSPLVNAATVSAPDPGFPGETLTATAEDSNIVRSLSVSKVSDAAAEPVDGDTVTFTVTVTNDGSGDYTADEPASVSDDLGDVLDDAEYAGDAVSTVGDAPVVSDGVLTWSGPLAAGESAVITYSVVLTGAGDQRVVNTACVPEGEVASGVEACAGLSFDVTVEPPVIPPTVPPVEPPPTVPPTVPPTPDPTTAPTTAPTTGLATTGGTIWTFGIVGALTLIGAGAVLMIMRRRRVSSDS